MRDVHGNTIACMQERHAACPVMGYTLNSGHQRVYRPCTCDCHQTGGERGVETMTFIQAVFAQLCRDDFPALARFCDDRGIEEGGWAIRDGVITYEDWAHGKNYELR